MPTWNCNRCDRLLDAVTCCHCPCTLTAFDRSMIREAIAEQRHLSRKNALRTILIVGDDEEDNESHQEN